MCDDSFDIEELVWDIDQKTITAWSSQVAPKMKGRRTYSRRGSTVSTGGLSSSITFNSRPPAEPFEEPNECLSPDEDQFGRRGSFPSFKLDAISIPAPRRFTRTRSISGVSGEIQPKPPTVLKKSQSVSSRLSITSTQRSSSLTQRSSSLSSGFDSIGDTENFDPNYDPLAENASPKRGAKPCIDLRGRKKGRIARNFGKADHAPLSSRPLSKSFSSLAQSGESGLSWAKLPCSDMSPFPPRPPPASDFNCTDFTESSPAASSVGSTRKRGIWESPLDDFDDCMSTGGFDVARPSKARCQPRLVLSPPSRSQSDFSSNSTEDRRNRRSEFSPKSTENKKKREAAIQSDDGDSGPDSKDGIDSGDDASIESSCNTRSPMPTFVPYSQQQQRRVTTFNGAFFVSSETLKPETADADDVIDSMSSYQDLKFLTKSLRRESGGCRQSWHVAPPVAWVTSRRDAFFQWATRSLGFTFRSGGMSVSYIQISKTKGEGILELLESTLAACKERGMGTNTPTNACGKKQQFDFSGARQPASVSKTLTLTPKELTRNSWQTTVADVADSNTLDSEIMQGMMTLAMKDNSHVRDEYPVKSSIIVEDPDDVSVHDPRHSLENYASARDLNFHLHGMTPVPRKSRRPPRLSLQSMGSVSTTGSRYNAASPFPQPPMSSVKHSSMTCAAYDFVETPMVKPPDRGWGSCPVNGRDWGSSECCDPAIIEELIRRLDQSRVEAGFSDSPGMLCEEGGLFRSSSLDLDLEAASGYREKADSPESLSNRDNTEDLVEFQAGCADSSPSAVSPIDKMDTILDRHVAFNDVGENRSREYRRRQTSFAKHKRISLFASAVNPAGSIFQNRKSLFIRPPRTFSSELLLEKLPMASAFCPPEEALLTDRVEEETSDSPLEIDAILQTIFRYLPEYELLCTASLVCSKWADAATHAHANLMLMSVGCTGTSDDLDDDSDDESSNEDIATESGVPGLLERPWQYLTNNFPWACFLSEGAYKRVYKVFNHTYRVEEAVSVMDVDLIESTGNMSVVGAELAVSVMLSSLVRRAVCPNFVVTRGVFSCPYEPPANYWGSATKKRPKGAVYSSPKVKRKPKEPGPNQRGRYQYIRMELCDSGDVEEFMKEQPDEALLPNEARRILFQISFALHAAADRFSLKHYDVKLLNVFLQRIKSEKSRDVVMRYGLGEHTFALRSPKERAIVAKLADYGTANVDSGSSGQQVTIAQFTTLENTPPDFLIFGDQASQGHGHDCFGLGLCMLHLFTGHAPYEEILEDISCPGNLKTKLRQIWESEDEAQYSVIRSVILSDVYKDEEGHIIEGEPDEVLYDTFYRFLVLFGIPDVPSRPTMSKVWVAVREALEESQETRGKGKSGKYCKRLQPNDVNRYCRDRRKYSLSHGNNKFIARARNALEAMDGGMELLLSLVSFDPQTRATALDVLNSSFMEPLRESPESAEYCAEDEVYSYMAFSTQN